MKTDTGYINLLAEILEEGVNNPNYFREPCGHQWCEIGGLDPEYMWRKAVLSKGRIPGEYVPLERCSDPHAWIGQNRIGIIPSYLKHTVWSERRIE